MMSWPTRLSLGYLLGLIGITLLLLVLPFDATLFDPRLAGTPMPPSLSHIFGTDDLGRDILLRALVGARVSLLVAILSIGISASIGTIIGVTAGYFGGKIDSFLMRSVDVLLAIPTIFLILTIQTILKPSIWNVVGVIGLTSWMGVSRLVRAEVLSIKERPFIQAARARQVSRFSLVWRHILPHALPPLIVAATLGMGHALLTESVLSFLGLGVQPPHPSWGNMLFDSLSYLREAPWMTFVPGLFITTTVLSLNFVGEELQKHYAP